MADLNQRNPEGEVAPGTDMEAAVVVEADARNWCDLSGEVRANSRLGILLAEADLPILRKTVNGFDQESQRDHRDRDPQRA